MIIHDDQGEDHGETDDIARRILREQITALKPLVGYFEQIELVLGAVSDSTRMGLLDDAEDIARRVGNCGHDLARLLHDLKRTDGG